jgi:hypothetical protein
MGQILHGNVGIMSAQDTVRDYLPGFDLLRYRGTGLIGFTAGTSWDIVDELGNNLTIPGAAGAGTITVYSITARVETALIGTTNGELLKVSDSVTGTAYAVQSAIASLALPVGVGYSPALGQAPLTSVVALTASTVLRLFLTSAGNTAPAGTLRSASARGTRIPVEVLALRRTPAIRLADVVLTDAQQRIDAGV